MLQLTEIADGVWGAETRHGLGLGASLPLRMTVLKDDDGLVLISPISLDDAGATQLDAIGRVHTLVGPNLLHHTHLAAAKQRYPHARLLGAPGLAKKKPDLDFDGELPAARVSVSVESLLVEGAKKLSEVVFLHKPSATLVVTDLVFNIYDQKGMSKLLLKLVSRALGQCEQSRLCRTYTNDRTATARSLRELLTWSFDRVVPAHGDVLERNAAEQLAAGVWWMRGEERRPITE